MNNLKKVLGLALVFAFSAYTKSQPTGCIKESRYVCKLPSPSPEQVDPMGVTVTLEFDSTVVTVGQAIDDLLSESGWSLPDEEVQDAAFKVIRSRRLPMVHRKIDGLPLRVALLMLVGESYFNAVEDPIYRMYSFELKPEFERVVKDAR